MPGLHILKHANNLQVFEDNPGEILRRLATTDETCQILGHKMNSLNWLPRNEEGRLKAKLTPRNVTKCCFTLGNLTYHPRRVVE